MENDTVILAEIDENVTQCQCCGKEHIKRTIHIESIDDLIGDIWIGVICASQWFKLNLTGNPFYAARKLQKHINNMDQAEFENIIEEIKEAAEEWKK